MNYYWFVSFIFNFIYQQIVLIAYMLFGRYISGISFFIETHFGVVFLAYTAWGLVSVSTAFLLSCFMNKATSAVMIGYVFSIIMVLGSSTMCCAGGIYNYPTDIKPRLRRRYYITPYLPYTRIFYILTEECGWKQCLSHWNHIPEEVWELIQVLYVQSFIILFIAIYLNEVVPQQYGVPKHPLFFLESFVVKNFPSLHPIIYGDDSELVSFRDESELLEEDMDVREEREVVN